MRNISRNVVGTILVASAYLIFALEIDAGWYYSWRAPSIFAAVAYFAFVRSPFLKILLLCLAVSAGLVLVLNFILVNQYDSGIEFFVFVMPILMANSNVFLAILMLSFGNPPPFPKR